MGWRVKGVGTGVAYWLDPNGGLTNRQSDAMEFASRPEAQDALDRIKWILQAGPLEFSIVNDNSEP